MTGVKSMQINQIYVSSSNLRIENTVLISMPDTKYTKIESKILRYLEEETNLYMNHISLLHS